jgi:hypothetical protein
MVILGEDIKQILKKTTIKIQPDNYAIVYIDPFEEEKARTLLSVASPFISVTSTGEEVTIVLRISDWEKHKVSFSSYKVAAPYRLITFDIVLDLSVVGFLSVISSALSAEGISIYALSTYLKDHILIKEEDIDRTVNILNNLVDSARKSK